VCFELERHFSVETDSIVSSFVRRKKLMSEDSMRAKEWMMPENRR
jgi:hypothetical protein